MPKCLGIQVGSVTFSMKSDGLLFFQPDGDSAAKLQYLRPAAKTIILKKSLISLSFIRRIPINLSKNREKGSLQYFLEIFAVPIISCAEYPLCLLSFVFIEKEKGL